MALPVGLRLRSQNILLIFSASFVCKFLDTQYILFCIMVYGSTIIYLQYNRPCKVQRLAWINVVFAFHLLFYYTIYCIMLLYVLSCCSILYLILLIGEGCTVTLGCLVSNTLSHWHSYHVSSYHKNVKMSSRQMFSFGKHLQLSQKRFYDVINFRIILILN